MNSPSLRVSFFLLKNVPQTWHVSRHLLDRMRGGIIAGVGTVFRYFWVQFVNLWRHLSFDRKLQIVKRLIWLKWSKNCFYDLWIPLELLENMRRFEGVEHWTLSLFKVWPLQTWQYFVTVFYNWYWLCLTVPLYCDFTGHVRSNVSWYRGERDFLSCYLFIDSSHW